MPMWYLDIAYVTKDTVAVDITITDSGKPPRTTRHQLSREVAQDIGQRLLDAAEGPTSTRSP